MHLQLKVSNADVRSALFLDVRLRSCSLVEQVTLNHSFTRVISRCYRIRYRNFAPRDGPSGKRVITNRPKCYEPRKASEGILFGEPFGNHSKFQVVIRMTAPSPSDEASETNARIDAITSKKVRESMCGAGEEGYLTVSVARQVGLPRRDIATARPASRHSFRSASVNGMTRSRSPLKPKT
jgi:hypothetical protein